MATPSGSARVTRRSDGNGPRFRGDDTVSSSPRTKSRRPASHGDFLRSQAGTHPLPAPWEIFTAALRLAALTFTAQAANSYCHGSKPAERVAPRGFRAETAAYYTAENYAAEDSIGYLIAALRNRLFRSLDMELHKFGFTAAQWPILRAVADDKTPIAADLCRKLNYDTGSMTRMLNRLEEKGVIVREPSSEDRRIVRLRMTAAGRGLSTRSCETQSSTCSISWSRAFPPTMSVTRSNSDAPHAHQHGALSMNGL